MDNIATNDDELSQSHFQTTAKQSEINKPYSKQHSFETENPALVNSHCFSRTKRCMQVHPVFFHLVLKYSSVNHYVSLTSKTSENFCVYETSSSIFSDLYNNHYCLPYVMCGFPPPVFCRAVGLTGWRWGGVSSTHGWVFIDATCCIVKKTRSLRDDPLPAVFLRQNTLNSDLVESLITPLIPE